MDAAEYKHVVLGLIFLKYVSDAFEEQHAKLDAEKAVLTPRNQTERQSALVKLAVWIACAILLAIDTPSVGAPPIRTFTVDQPWSHEPPGGLPAKAIPQLVAVTFDDNFGLASPGAVGGVRAVVDFFTHHRNPCGTGDAGNFDGLPIRTTFFDTTIYMVPHSVRVLGGARGEDEEKRNLSAWRAAFAAGEEIADHTVNHFNGGVVSLGPDACCRPRKWNVEQWTREIVAAKHMLVDKIGGVGAIPDDIRGFRAPYFSYTDALLDALATHGFLYDSTIPSCFGSDEDGGNCAWPYTLDAGSPDAAILAKKFDSPSGWRPRQFPPVGAHPGLWELPPTTLVVPPDSAAVQYGFRPGLRTRIAALGSLRFPSIYEPATGKIVGMDFTLLIDAKVTGDEMRAILEYNLDLHIHGNRAPFVFVAHSHLYAYSSPDDNPDTPSDTVRQARWKGLTDFLGYALSKPEVRLVSARDVLSWVRRGG